MISLDYLEEKVYKKVSVLQLRALIVQMCGKFAEDMCRRLITNVVIRVYEVLRQDGGHIQHLIYK